MKKKVVDEVGEEVELSFEFKEEREIMCDHEMWRSVISKPESEKKRRAVINLSSTSELSSTDDKSIQVLESAGQPTGVKKGKFAVYLNDCIIHLSNKLDENNQKGLDVEVMLAHLKQESEDNFSCIKLLLAENTRALTSSITFKAVMGSDFSGQTAQLTRITRIVTYNRTNNCKQLSLFHALTL